VRVRCSQCGASLAVLEREFYLRCPSCGARNLLRSPGDDVLLVLPARTPDQTRRLFPSGADLGIRLRYYPYCDASGRLEPFFNTPSPDLAGYVPPAGATTVFSADAVDPDDLIPMAGPPEGRRIVFHPFHEVRSTDPSHERIVLVDAVSGLRPGTGQADAGASDKLPSRSFLISFACGAVLSAIVYTTASLAGARSSDALALSFPAALLGSAAAAYRILR